MPSTVTGSFSGGTLLVSGGDILSGSLFPIGGLQFFLDNDAPGPQWIGLPNLSGAVNTINSGGSQSSGLAAGYLADGMKVPPGGDYFVPKCRLTSGLSTVRLLTLAAGSGGRMYYEWF